MPDQDEDWFSPGLESVAAQQPIWPVQQGWQRPQSTFDERWGSMDQLSHAPPQPHDDSMSGPTPDWMNRGYNLFNRYIGQHLSDLSGQDYLGAISLAKVGKPMWGEQDYHMMNEQGQKVGDLTASFEEPDLMHIGWEGGGEKNRLGFANSRSVLPELMREYPNAKRFTAFRMSGARHGPAAKYKGEPHLAEDPYMRPIINIPSHIKANPPNQWSGKWLHEDSGKWYDDNLDPRTIRRIEIEDEGRLSRAAEGTEVPPDLRNRILSAARARESVNTPQELANLNRNLSGWRERLERDRANLQRVQQPPDPVPDWRSDQQSRVGTVRTPPAPPAPQPEVTSPNYGFNPTRYGVPTGQQTPGPFRSFDPGIYPSTYSLPMGTFQSQPMNLQMMADQLNRSRQGYGGAGSQRMEEE